MVSTQQHKHIKEIKGYQLWILFSLKKLLHKGNNAPAPPPQWSFIAVLARCLQPEHDDKFVAMRKIVEKEDEQTITEMEQTKQR